MSSPAPLTHDQAVALAIRAVRECVAVEKWMADLLTAGADVAPYGLAIRIAVEWLLLEHPRDKALAKLAHELLYSERFPELVGRADPASGRYVAISSGK